MVVNKDNFSNVLVDPRFEAALALFNSGEWYSAHDAFEELWHETNGVERRTLQGFLQVAVAQVHLERGNKNGAAILYGESLTRLRKIDTPDFGLDVQQLCKCVEKRLKLLQEGQDPKYCSLPSLSEKIYLHDLNS